MVKMYLNRTDLSALIQKMLELHIPIYYFEHQLHALDNVIDITGNTSIKTEVELSEKDLYVINRGMNND